MRKQHYIPLLILLIATLLLSACGSSNQQSNPTIKEAEKLGTFTGYYTNDGKTERTKLVDAILSAVENRPIDHPLLLENTTYKDFIYHWVDDPLDCFPSAEHPVYSVIVDLAGECLIDKDCYSVVYTFNNGNVSFNLSFSISHDLQNITLFDLTIDHRTQYWYEDFTQEEMTKKVVSIIKRYAPEMCNEFTTVYGEVIQDGDEWALSLIESIPLDGAECSILYFYPDQLVGNFPVGFYSNGTVIIECMIEKNDAKYYILEPELNQFVERDPYAEAVQEAIDRIEQGYEEEPSFESGLENTFIHDGIALSADYYWYGNDVFATFFAECFADGSAISWEHLGTNGDYFTLPGENSTTWVDVYRVYMADGSSDCYYIIPYGEIQLTEVYRATNQDDVELVWSVPLNEYYEWMN